MLELANVRLNVDCAEGFDHTFDAGEIAVVLGANLAGKTDLCRLICGLNTQAQAEIHLDGANLHGVKPQNRPVSMVYQAFVNYPNLTVADNIASPMRASRMTATEQRSRVAELSEMLQITEFLKRYPHELSGGQQQRLAIARALAKNARVLLLDEPLVNLDFKLREVLESELRDLLKATNTVVIYTSSDPRDAFSLGDQLLLLAHGQKIQAGSPLDVYCQPANLTAMELLAEPCVNRFERIGKTCALRPEHVAVGTTMDANNIAFDLSVTAYETSGDESFIHGRVGDHDWVVRSHGMPDVQIGDKLDLHARSDDVVSF